MQLAYIGWSSSFCWPPSSPSSLYEAWYSILWSELGIDNTYSPDSCMKMWLFFQRPKGKESLAKTGQYGGRGGHPSGGGQAAGGEGWWGDEPELSWDFWHPGLHIILIAVLDKESTCQWMSWGIEEFLASECSIKQRIRFNNLNRATVVGNRALAQSQVPKKAALEVEWAGTQRLEHFLMWLLVVDRSIFAHPILDCKCSTVQYPMFRFSLMRAQGGLNVRMVVTLAPQPSMFY